MKLERKVEISAFGSREFDRMLANPYLLAQVVGSVCWLVLTGPGLAGPAAAASPEPVARVLLRDEAVGWALRNNPELAALRQQHGIAAAGVVIARAYPFNPAWEAKVFGVSTPESAGVTNRVPNEHKILFDVELRGQGKYRRQAAQAALSRTEWEIAFQETTVAVRVLRAFDAVLYRREKLQLVNDTIRLNEAAARDISKLIDQGKLRGADAIVARAEVHDARAQLSTGRALLTMARFDLKRALGMIDGTAEPQGSLEMAFAGWDITTLTQAALEKRADLHARQSAVGEAEARLRLEIANRFGHATVGPAYVYDPARISEIGVHFTLPLPVLNRHQGEILQRKAEVAKGALEVRQAEVTICQDVQQALARLDEASAGLKTYQDKILPDLQAGLKELERLYAKQDPAVDLSRLVDFRRKLLKARAGYMDALFEARQAQADLAAAVGDPAVAIAPTCCRQNH